MAKFGAVSSVIWGLAFLWAAAVQYNDPDPWRWVLIYGVAGLVSVGVPFAGRRSWVRRLCLGWALVGGVGALVSLWLCWSALGAAEVDLDWGQAFGPGGMMAAGVEEMREGMGLAIVALRMLLSSRQLQTID